MLIKNTALTARLSATMVFQSLTALALVALMLITVGCQDSKKENRIGNTGPYVVATTSIIADVAKVIGGKRTVVEGLMGAGVDPHLYKASHGDIARLDAADLVLYNGLHLEGKMIAALERMADQKPTVAVTDNIPRESLLAPKAYSAQYDPHVWFDISFWSSAAERISEALVKLDSAGAEYYTTRLAEYQDSLQVLHQWAKKRLAEIPDENRVMVTAHDAFEYFGRAYNIEVRGLQGISTVSEYGLNDITSMVDMLVERNIKAVFIESSVSPRSIEAVVDGCLARGHNIVIGGELFSDALGGADTPEGTYIGMTRHNINTIVEALK